MKAADALDIIANGKKLVVTSTCPWQEIRLLPALHWQIDFILLEHEVYNIDRFELGNALIKMYYDMDFNLPYPYKAHAAINPKPIYRNFRYTFPSKAIQDKKLSAGWEHTIVDLSMDYTLAIREKPGYFEASVAAFGTPK